MILLFIIANAQFPSRPEMRTGSVHTFVWMSQTSQVRLDLHHNAGSNQETVQPQSWSEMIVVVLARLDMGQAFEILDTW